MDKTQNWFNLAEEDLLWAQASFKDGILRGACFASQQAAEKALKAFLVSKGIRVAKIHDLLTINQKCIEIDPSFVEVEEYCNKLSSYYLSTRYPDIAYFEEFSEDQTRETMDEARRVVNFVKMRLV